MKQQEMDRPKTRLQHAREDLTKSVIALVAAYDRGGFQSRRELAVGQVILCQNRITEIEAE